MSTRLSDCIRPNSEAAPWVIDAVVRLEQEIERLKAHRELCTDNLLKGYDTGKAEERAAVVAHLRERAIHGAGNTITVEDACTILANLFERGEHRQEGGI